MYYDGTYLVMLTLTPKDFGKISSNHTNAKQNKYNLSCSHRNIFMHAGNNKSPYEILVTSALLAY